MTCISAIAWIVIHMLAVKAFGAVIGIAIAGYRGPAVITGKIFDAALEFFHRKSIHKQSFLRKQESKRNEIPAQERCAGGNDNEDGGYMAKSLNKSRIRDSKIIVLTMFVIILFSNQLVMLGHESPLHETFDFLGYLLVAFCALGRVYSTAFLGGFKNENLIDYGIYSVVRNPLYFFSLIGIAGIALMSNHVLVIALVPLSFIFIYIKLIKREEEFLKKKFGKKYTEYMKRTPRLLPNIKLYHAPETVQMAPQFITKAFGDAIWWFAAFPLIELVEYVQANNIIHPLFFVP